MEREREDCLFQKTKGLTAPPPPPPKKEPGVSCKQQEDLAKVGQIITEKKRKWNCVWVHPTLWTFLAVFRLRDLDAYGVLAWVGR